MRCVLQELCKALVEVFALAELAVDEAHGVHLGAHAQLEVGQAEDVLHEDVAQAVFLEPQLADVFVAAAQWCLELHGEPGHYCVGASVVQLGEADAVGEQELVAAVLEVVLVGGVVDNALKVAFVVAHLVF